MKKILVHGVYIYMYMYIHVCIGIYMAEGGIMTTAPGGGASYMTPPTPAMRPPMSRLGRRSSSDEFSVFPDPAKVELAASATNPDLFSRSLAECWWTQSIENLQRQVGWVE